MAPGDNRGFTLIEAVIALAILSAACVATMGILGAGMRSVEVSADRETVVRNASRVLAATTLLTRAELDQRIGTHPLGEFQVDVRRPEPDLFRIAIAETTAPDLELLVTVVYRTAE